MANDDDKKLQRTHQRRGDGQDEGPRRPGFWQVAGSVAAAAFGVRAHKHQERDFGSRSAMPFIIGGLIFTLLFIAGLAMIVHLVLSSYSG